MSVPTVTLTKHGGLAVRLGRVKPAVPKRRLRLENYLILAEIRKLIPAAVDWTEKGAASLARMYRNDVLGCCVIAGEFHLVGVRSGNESGTPAVFPDTDVDALYTGICGPGDQGCQITDVLDYQVKTGFPGGHKLAGYVALDNAVPDQVKASIYLFGGCTIGMGVTQAMVDAAQPGGFVWDDSTDPVIGGHEVVLVGFDATGVKFSTWGMVGTMTWALLANKKYVDECYTHVSQDWVSGGKPAPNGLDLEALTTDLHLTGGGTVPPIPDPVTPPPDPTPVPATDNTLTVSATLPAGTYTAGNVTFTLDADEQPGTYPITPAAPAPDPTPTPDPVPAPAGFPVSLTATDADGTTQEYVPAPPAAASASVLHTIAEEVSASAAVIESEDNDGARTAPMPPSILQQILAAVMALLTGCKMTPAAALAKMNYPDHLDEALLHRECRKAFPRDRTKREAAYKALRDKGRSIQLPEVTALLK